MHAHPPVGKDDKWAVWKWAWTEYKWLFMSSKHPCSVSFFIRSVAQIESPQVAAHTNISFPNHSLKRTAKH